MSTMIFESQASPVSSKNVYVNQLIGSLDSRQSTIDWLVVSHDVSTGLKRILDTIRSDAAAVLAIPQRQWDFRGDALPRAISCSVTELGAKHVLFVGHSAALVENDLPQSAGEDCEAGGAANSLLGGAVRNQLDLQRAKDHFASRLKELNEIPEIRDALAARRLQLHGLFFLEESNCYLAFDFASQSLKPLTR